MMEKIKYEITSKTNYVIRYETLISIGHNFTTFNSSQTNLNFCFTVT